MEPPQCKRRVPQHSGDKFQLSELELLGVFGCAEEVDVSVKCLNTSYLIKKPNGSYRLNKCLLPDCRVQIVDEVVRCCDTIPWSKSL